MISVIIPSRGESVALWMTVASAKADLEASGLEHEIIVVCNEKDGVDFPPVAYFMQMNSLAQVMFTRASGPSEARNYGAMKAKGNFLVFSDAHCVFPPKFFLRMLGTQIETDADAIFGGTRFCDKTTYGCTVGWEDILWGMDLVEPEPSSEPFPVVSVGHGVFGITAKAFFEVGMYWDALRGWGGEEPQLNLKLWMMGKRLMLVPDLYHLHYTLPGVRRGFELYKDRDFVRNFLLVSAAYGGDARTEKTYNAFVMNYWMGERHHKDVLAEVLNSEAVRKERKFISERAKYKSLEVLRSMFSEEKVVQ